MLKAPSSTVASAAVVASLCLVSIGACTESTVIGADDFAGEALRITSDTLPVRLTTVPAATSLATGSLGTTAAYVGCLSSETTGLTRATLGLELRELPNDGSPRGGFDATGVTVDSVRLVLPLASRRFFVGDTTAEVSFRVESVEAGSIGREEATLADSVASGGTVYGTYVGTLPEAPFVVNTFVDDSIRVDTVEPQLRIPLGDGFVADLTTALARASPADTLVNDTAFVERLPGLLLRGTTCGAVLPAFSLSPADAEQFGVTVYYTEDGVQRQYRLVNRRVNTAGQLATTGVPLRLAYANEYGGSTAEALLAGADVEGVGAIVQGLQGLNARVDFDALDFAGERGINFAELILPVAEVVSGDSLPTPVRPFDALVLQVANSSGDLVGYSADPNAQTFTTAEGGLLETVAAPGGGLDSVRQYRFNVTTLLQEAISGEREPSVFVTPLSADILAGESALVGMGETGARVRVVTTELP